MHTYMKVGGEDLWVVGYWLRESDGHRWHALSDHTDQRDAMERVNYLNGGNSHVYIEELT